MTKRAVVYVTDGGFLFPSIVSALQARERTDRREVQILLYLVDPNQRDLDALRTILDRNGLSVLPLQSDAFAIPEGTDFRLGHVPVATLARLVIAPFLPKEVEHIVYIDGDTQIIGDIEPLVMATVPAGRVAGAPGGLWIREKEIGREARADRKYLNALRVDDAFRYHNAGVLACSVSTWAEVGPSALRYFVENSSICRQHDQSALNSILQERWATISPRYNFHSGYGEVGALNILNPSIVHFTGPIKPWHNNIGWCATFAAAYDECRRRMPEITRFEAPAPPGQGARAEAYWRTLSNKRRILFWRNALRRKIIRTEVQKREFFVS